MRALDETLRGVPDVRSVVYPGDWVEVVSKVKGFVGLFTLILSILLLLAAILLIWNTIRTAMYARRREIEVMKLVGATDWFIRIPFMLEGLIQGLLGALVAIPVVTWFVKDLEEQAQGAGLLSAFSVSSSQLTQASIWIVVVGAAVSLIGSGIAVSRFLKV
jgi:cell division transport system permease protein